MSFFGEFVISERDNSLRAAAERYVRECEIYDRSVCTGPVTHDGVMPVGSKQLGLVSRNAGVVIDRICARTGFSRMELIRAAAKIDPRSIEL